MIMLITTNNIIQEAITQLSVGRGPTCTTAPSVQLDLEYKTICRRTSDSRTCHKAVSDSRSCHAALTDSRCKTSLFGQWDQSAVRIPLYSKLRFRNPLIHLLTYIVLQHTAITCSYQNVTRELSTPSTGGVHP